MNFNNNDNNNNRQHGGVDDNHGDAVDNHGDPVDDFEDGFGGLEELAQCSPEEYELEHDQHTDHFEQCWVHLGHSGLPGVDELNPACIAMLNSLESRERFLHEWAVNRQRLLDGMRNCLAFQGILGRLQD